MKREFLDYVKDVLNSINDIGLFIDGIKNFQEFEMDRKTVNAVIRSLEIIGEAVKNIPIDVKNKYSNIPWKDIAGMRDKLAHEYFGIDEEIVWKVSLEKLPPLKSLFQKILSDNLVN